MRVTPPTIRDLLDDTIYRAYVRQVPARTVTYAGVTRPHPAFTFPGAWGVWARTEAGRWRTGTFDAYPDAWRTTVKAYRNPDIADVALVSRRVFYGPPGEWYKVRVKVPPRQGQPATTRIEERWRVTFHWDSGLEWCARCRRPSAFRNLTPDHHALRHAIAISEDNGGGRCVFCGIRSAALPDIDTLIG